MGWTFNKSVKLIILSCSQVIGISETDTCRNFFLGNYRNLTGIFLQYAQAQATEQTGTSEADSAAQISSNENNLTINVAESCDWVGRAIENMESFDEDIPECVSDVDSECSNPEVVDPSPPGENLQAEAGLACDQPINNAATVRTLPPLQQQPRKSPQKVKFVDESKDYEAACDHYEDFGEESLEYESEYAKGSEDLCRGLSGISMHSRHGSGVGLPEYSGTHVRFNYNSDDEAEEEEVPKVELLPSTKQPSLSTSKHSDLLPFIELLHKLLHDVFLCFPDVHSSLSSCIGMYSGAVEILCCASHSFETLKLFKNYYIIKDWLISFLGII